MEKCPNKVRYCVLKSPKTRQMAMTYERQISPTILYYSAKGPHSTGNNCGWVGPDSGNLYLCDRCILRHIW